MIIFLFLVFFIFIFVSKKESIMKLYFLLFLTLFISACASSGSQSPDFGSDGEMPYLKPLTEAEIKAVKNVTNSEAYVENSSDLIARAQDVYGDVYSIEAKHSYNASGRRPSSGNNYEDRIDKAKKHFEEAKLIFSDNGKWFLENYDNISEVEFEKAVKLLQLGDLTKEVYKEKINQNELSEINKIVNSLRNNLVLEDLYSGGFNMGYTYYYPDNTEEMVPANGIKNTARLVIDKKTKKVYIRTFVQEGLEFRYQGFDWVMKDKKHGGKCSYGDCICNGIYGCVVENYELASLDDIKNGVIKLYSQNQNENNEMTISFLNKLDNLGLKYSDVILNEQITHNNITDKDYELIEKRIAGYDSMLVDMNRIANNLDAAVEYKGKAYGEVRNVKETFEPNPETVASKKLYNFGNGAGAIGADATLTFDATSGVPVEKLFAKFSDFGWYDVNIVKKEGNVSVDLSGTPSDFLVNGSPDKAELTTKYYGEFSEKPATEVVGTGSVEWASSDNAEFDKTILDFSFGGVNSAK